MKKSIMSILLLFLQLSSHLLHAGMYPVITEIKTEIVTSRSAIYYFKQQLVDIGPASDIICPAGWRVGLVHRHDAFPGGEDIVKAEGGDFCYYNSKNIGEVARRNYEISGKFRTWISHLGYGNGNECVGYVAYSDNNVKWSTAIFPAGACVYAPPGNEWCEVVTPTITLDHGVLNIGTGHTTTSKFDAKCTAPMKVRLVLGQDSVSLGDGKSKLEIPGSVGGFHSLHEGMNNLSMVSSLTLPPTAAGIYQGSTVLYLQYY